MVAAGFEHLHFLLKSLGRILGLKSIVFWGDEYHRIKRIKHVSSVRFTETTDGKLFNKIVLEYCFGEIGSFIRYVGGCHIFRIGEGIFL